MPKTVSATACDVCGRGVFDGCTCPPHPSEGVLVAMALSRVVGDDPLLCRRIVSSLNAEGFLVLPASDVLAIMARLVELQAAVDRMVGAHPHEVQAIARAARVGKIRFGV